MPRLPWDWPPKTQREENAMVKEYLSQLKEEELGRLYEVYKYDFEIFGYSPELR